MTNFDDITRTEQASLLRDLATLDDAAWQTRTVCPAWTVRGVVAHLIAFGSQTKGDFLRGVVRHRGDFDAITGAGVARYDVGSAEEMIAALAAVDLATPKLPIPKYVPPSETMVHADDIRSVLGLARPTEPAHAAAVLSSYVKTGKPIGGKRRTKGLSLRATDADWSHGDGPEVVGPAFDLMLAIGGRTGGLDACRGEGVEIMRSR